MPFYGKCYCERQVILRMRKNIKAKRGLLVLLYEKYCSSRDLRIIYTIDISHNTLSFNISIVCKINY
jgi:hypothetical protein